MGKQILVSPEVLRKSAQGLAAAKEELTYLIEALERVLQSARRNCNSLEDIRKELRQTADDAEAAEREIQQKFGFLFPDKNV